MRKNKLLKKVAAIVSAVAMAVATVPFVGGTSEVKAATQTKTFVLDADEVGVKALSETSLQLGTDGYFTAKATANKKASVAALTSIKTNNNTDVCYPSDSFDQSIAETDLGKTFTNGVALTGGGITAEANAIAFTTESANAKLVVYYAPKWTSAATLKLCKASDLSEVAKAKSTATETHAKLEKWEYTIANPGSYSIGFSSSGGVITYMSVQDTVSLDTKYSITLSDDGNGTISAPVPSAVEGTQISLSIKPNVGYKFKEWDVISGNVSITNNTFVMPSENVEIKGIFEEINYDTSVNDFSTNLASAQSTTVDAAICPYFYAVGSIAKESRGLKMSQSSSNANSVAFKLDRAATVKVTLCGGNASAKDYTVIIEKSSDNKVTHDFNVDRDTNTDFETLLSAGTYYIYNSANSGGSFYIKSISVKYLDTNFFVQYKQTENGYTVRFVYTLPKLDLVNYKKVGVNLKNDTKETESFQDTTVFDSVTASGAVISSTGNAYVVVEVKNVPAGATIMAQPEQTTTANATTATASTPWYSFTTPSAS